MHRCESRCYSVPAAILANGFGSRGCFGSLALIVGMSVRFTRMTSAFSKIDNHEATIALHDMLDNVGRIHKSQRVTPAMEAGVADRVWSREEIAGLGIS